MTILLAAYIDAPAQEIARATSVTQEADAQHQPDLSGKETVWIDGLLPEPSKTDGIWQWDEQVKHDDKPAHTNQTAQGIQGHSFRTEQSVAIDNKTKVIQYILLDKGHPPDGIMIKFLVKGEREITLYLEGDEEVFADMNEYISAWYMGRPPAAGEWARLDMDFKELDLKEGLLEGISFITADGKVWWGKTVIIKSQQEVE